MYESEYKGYWNICLFKKIKILMIEFAIFSCGKFTKYEKSQLRIKKSDTSEFIDKLMH